MKNTPTWLRNLPPEWDIIQIKHLALSGRESFIDGDWIESQNISTEGIRYLTSGNVGEGKFKEQGNGFVTEDICRELNCKYAYPGDFVFSRLNSPQGRSCILPDTFEKYVLAVDNVILRTGENKEYLNFVTQSKGYKESTKLKSSGSTMQRISRSDLGSIQIPLPPRKTQDAIARFLTKATRKVDAAIAIKEQQLAALSSYRQSLITRAVTKGLDPNVGMKDSGYDITNDIPVHWSTIKLQYICKITTGNQDTQDAVIDGQYPFYVRSPKIERTNLVTHSGTGILMAGDGVGAGKVFHYAEGQYGIHQRVYLLHEISDVIDPKFLFFYIKTIFSKEVERGTAQSTVPSIRMPMLTRFSVCLPPKREQIEISNYCKTIEEKIESVSETIKNTINALQEYRSSLISAAVTGQLAIEDKEAVA